MVKWLIRLLGWLIPGSRQWAEEYIQRFMMPIYNEMLALGIDQDEAWQLIDRANRRANLPDGPTPAGIARHYVNLLMAGKSPADILEGKYDA